MTGDEEHGYIDTVEMGVKWRSIREQVALDEQGSSWRYRIATWSHIWPSVNDYAPLNGPVGEGLNINVSWLLLTY